MNFDNLVHGKLIKRYKRFLADIKLDSREIITAHCTNSGSMKSCIEENAEVYISPNDNPNRKTKYTWEMIKINNSWVGINTMIPNKLAFDFIKEQKIENLRNYTQLRREVTYGNSRIDLLAENEHEKCYIEVKNVTMKDGKYARFPDAVTTRSKKHLETLMEVKAKGARAVMLYIIQRTDVDIFSTAPEIDIEYAKTLKIAYENGVEVIPVQVKVSPEKIEFYKILPFEL